MFQVYEVAPVAVKLAEEPEHTVALEAATVGVAFTVTLKVLVFTHPEFAPVTV